MARRLAVLAMALGMAANAAPPGPTGNPTMNDAQAKALELIKQPDATYQAMDSAARQALHARLSSALAPRLPPPGSPPATAQAVTAMLALAGPAKVTAAQAGKVPLLVAAQFSGQRGWEVEWGSNLLLVAANLSTGQVTVGHGKHLDKIKPPPPSQGEPAPAASEAAARMVALEQQAYDIAGQPFNLGSPKQIGEILFNRLGLPVKKKTASGAPSTDEEVLQELAADYPLPAKLLEHRSLSKLKGTYTDKLPLMVNPQTGREHTN